MVPRADRVGTMVGTAFSGARWDACWKVSPGERVSPLYDITPATMTQRQKAAVIVRLLLAHGVSPGLDKLSPAHQGVLARAMSGLGQIDRATLASIVTEFTDALDRLALTMPRGMHDVLEILNPYISAHGARRAEGRGRDRRRHRSMAAPCRDGARPAAPHPRRGKCRDLRDSPLQAQRREGGEPPVRPAPGAGRTHRPCRRPDRDGDARHDAQDRRAAPCPDRRGSEARLPHRCP
jgi:hypothetical protein